MNHELELREPFFSDVVSGRKMFEVRWEREGRHFSVGDVLTFTDPDDTVRTHQRVVVYVLRNLDWYGVPQGLAILGLQLDSPAPKGT